MESPEQGIFYLSGEGSGMGTLELDISKPIGPDGMHPRVLRAG